MFVHAVYFWLHDGLSADDHARFEAGLQSLKAIEDVHEGYVGVPAPSDRPVVQSGYSHALVLVFRDAAAHDRYQVHPDHDRFREQCSPLWHKVVIYDSTGADAA